MFKPDWHETARDLPEYERRVIGIWQARNHADIPRPRMAAVVYLSTVTGDGDWRGDVSGVGMIQPDYWTEFPDEIPEN